MGLDVFEIILEVEDAFGIVIPDKETSYVQTVGELHALVLTTLRNTTRDSKNHRCYKCRYNLHGLRDNACPKCGTLFVQSDDIAPELVWKILVDVICEQLEVKPERVRPDTRFIGDLSKS